MQMGGPNCGCGNRGCLEALASRTAIERDIRAALAAGRHQQAHRALRRRPERDPQRRDPQSPQGRRCLGRRHPASRRRDLGLRLPDRPPPRRSGGHRPGRRPDRGLQRIHDADRGEHRRVRPPAGSPRWRARIAFRAGRRRRGLGAVALARKRVGRSPFKKRYRVGPTYPEVGRFSFGEVVVGKKAYNQDIYIAVSGKVKIPRAELCPTPGGRAADDRGRRRWKKSARAARRYFLSAARRSRNIALSEQAQRVSSQRSIRCEILPALQLVDVYNKSKSRKSALIHVTS